MTDEKTSLEWLSDAHDLVELHKFMEDDAFGEALDIALKCIAKPDLPPAFAKQNLIKLEALAFKFKMMGQVYMTIKQGRAGTDENKKKNVYFSASEQCHELAAAMKYIIKETG